MIGKQDGCKHVNICGAQTFQDTEKDAPAAPDQVFLSGEIMAKGTTVRRREKKKSSSTDHFTENNFDNSKKDVSSSHASIKESLRDHCVWRYCIFAVLLSAGSVSLFCLKDAELFSRTWRSIKAQSTFGRSADHSNEELPCNFGDDFTVDRRSNLSLEEFIRCYDAKR